MEQWAKLNEERASLAKTQIKQLKIELAKAQSSSAINWAFVIAAIILGMLIGRFVIKLVVISLRKILRLCPELFNVTKMSIQTYV